MIADADFIYQGIWQGSQPPTGPAVRAAGFDLVVLCAQEYQPPDEEFPGVDVVHAANDDGDRSSREQLGGAIKAARRVADAVRKGKKALVTCHMGLNRSGLVSALAVHMLTGWSGKKCVSVVKGRRPCALSNKHFVQMLSRIRYQADPTRQAVWKISLASLRV